MFNSVQYVRDVCDTRKISVCRLEKDCGFSNGYLNPKKMKKIPYDRAVVIAKYLNIPVNYILNRPDNENSPSEEVLTEGELEMLELFRLIPVDRQPEALELLRVTLKMMQKP